MTTMLGGLVADGGGVCAAPGTLATTPPRAAIDSATVASALTNRFMTSALCAKSEDHGTVRAARPCCPFPLWNLAPFREKHCSHVLSRHRCQRGRQVDGLAAHRAG